MHFIFCIYHNCLFFHLSVATRHELPHRYEPYLPQRMKDNENVNTNCARGVAAIFVVRSHNVPFHLISFCRCLSVSPSVSLCTILLHFTVAQLPCTYNLICSMSIVIRHCIVCFDIITASAYIFCIKHFLSSSNVDFNMFTSIFSLSISSALLPF